MKKRTSIGTIVFILGILLSVAMNGQQPNPPASNRSSILILGTGTPGITAERSGTSIGIIVRGTVYIFDAGPGVERRMLEARAKASNRIDHFGPVFISHLHSDHTLGLPAMLYYERERNQPFTLFGPPGLKNMMDHILAAYAEDRDIRMKGLEHAPAVRWETKVTEVTSGVVFQDANVTVKAFEVPHGNWEHALGYRIDAPDRSIVISGDTRPSEALVNACNGCDVLLHEIGDRSMGPSPEYMAQFHTSPAELGDIASRAKPKLLLLYHSAVRSQTDALREIGNGFHGPAVFVRDLDVF
jgi:ribonuclease BN (tRNA processing enzyme)